MDSRDLSTNTKENYRTDLRVHVRPFFEHYTLGEITTGRIESFLKAEAAVSYSRAKHSRNVLNQLFLFALRHDVLPRNPLEGTSQLPKPKTQVRALNLEQVQVIRAAAALKCLYLVTRSLDPTGRGRARWVIRWKAALNAFAITFEGRINPSSN
jgi:site-specific recombinase XerD